MRDPADILEEAKDVVDEITDLDTPLPVLDELAEYIKSVRDICESLSEESLEVKLQPTPSSPGTSSAPTNAAT